MENKDKPAYPIRSDEGGYNQNGLTKREYFAAMAMQGLLSQTARYDSNMILSLTGDAIEFADELLKQLK
ncbi:MAG: hypothetical protein QOA70_06790 [Nitrososphaeraceae archaeon]|nr:hypothetical protein [Nitrososphaeraceae archaeon]